MLDLQISDPHRLVSIIVSSHFPGETPTNIRFVGSGACNVVYGARVDDFEVAVRLTDRRRRGGEHAKEAWCIERAAAVGVEGPVVFGLGVIEDLSYMVQKFFFGERGDSPLVDHAHIWRRLGEYAFRIHSIEATDYIEADSVQSDWAERKWARYIDYGIESLTDSDRLIEIGVYRMHEQTEIRSVFRSLQRQRFRFGLCHGDLSIVNTIVNTDGKVALLDWGCASVGIVPHVDISAILRTMSIDDSRFGMFLSGYELSTADFAVIYPQIQDFRLLQAFDLVRWSIDRRPEELDDYASRAMETWAKYRMKSIE